MKRLLAQLLVSIKYEGLLELDVDEIVKMSKDYMRKEGFVIHEGIYKNEDEILDDIDELEDKNEPDVELKKKYLYEKDNFYITLTRKSIDMVVDAVLEYKGFKYYKKYVTYIMKVIEEYYPNILNIQKIRVRKINNLYLRDISYIGEYFKEDIFNASKVNELLGEQDDKMLISKMLYAMHAKQHKFLLNTEVMLGDVQNGEEHLDMYRIILDSDAYWDIALENYESIDDKIYELSEYATKIYFKCLNEDFKKKLLSDVDIVDNNIQGGIKDDDHNI